VVNELMTTGSGSTLQCKQGVQKHNPYQVSFLPFVLVLVKRSEDSVLADGTEVRAVFNFNIGNWKPEECPYCLAGGEAIKPKASSLNWRKLTGAA
jgi:hypothetical protein